MLQNPCTHYTCIVIAGKVVEKSPLRVASSLTEFSKNSVRFIRRKLNSRFSLENKNNTINRRILTNNPNHIWIIE